MHGNVEIRPADAGQAQRAGELIYATAPALLSALAGSAQAATELQTRQWPGAMGLSSWTGATGAYADGELVGLLVASDCATYHRQGEDTGAAMVAVAPPEVAERIGNLWPTISFLLPAVPPDAWYVTFLAVHDSWRGKGLGARLLRTAFERAQAAGAASVHLDAYITNPAVEFYRAMGMRRVAETRLPELEARLSLPIYARMVRDLER